MKVLIDRDQCTGIGNCVAVAPSVFKLDKQDKAVAANAGSVSPEKLREAAESCPMNAVILQDDQGEQIYP
jgi:ferredoxin